jgi:hypothetical protein
MLRRAVFTFSAPPERAPQGREAPAAPKGRGRNRRRGSAWRAANRAFRQLGRYPALESDAGSLGMAFFGRASAKSWLACRLSQN